MSEAPVVAKPSVQVESLRKGWGTGTDSIVRQLNVYSTRRSPCFAGARTFLLNYKINPSSVFYEICVGGSLGQYYFMESTRKINANDVKRTIKRRGVGALLRITDTHVFLWDSMAENSVEMDWHNPPNEPRLAVLVPIYQGKCDFTKPALFLYKPEVKPERKRTTMPKRSSRIPHPLIYR